MKQLIWKAIKSSFGLYELTPFDLKSDTKEEMKYKDDVAMTVQIATFIIFLTILFTVTGLLIVNK